MLTPPIRERGKSFILDDMFVNVKVALLRSKVIDQVLTNIAKKHKYKQISSYVSHIEDMLTLYAED
jgi:hypothetical protein